jgi:hypothetical protein
MRTRPRMQTVTRPVVINEIDPPLPLFPLASRPRALRELRRNRAGVLNKRCSLLAFSTRTFHVKRSRVAANIKLIVPRLLVTRNCRDSGFQLRKELELAGFFGRNVSRETFLLGQ